MEYDRVRRKVILLGGQDQSGTLGDVWEWDGTDWQATNGPPGAAVDFEAATYDSLRNRIVTFGIAFDTLFGYSADNISTIWELATGCADLGAGQVGGAQLHCSNMPRVRTNFCLSFANPGGLGLLALGPLHSQPGLSAFPPVFCQAATLYPDLTLPVVLLPVASDPGTLCFTTGDDSVFLSLIAQAFTVRSPLCLTATSALGIVVLPLR